MIPNNPQYFENQQTTYGVRRIGPMANNTHDQRYRDVSHLSANGQVAPMSFGGLQYGAANNDSENDDKGDSQVMTYVIYASGGIATGAALFFIAKKLGWV